jgi:hypothetical protein
VEVGWINGVNPKTARSLVEAGVLVEDMPFDMDANTNSHVRLPRLEEVYPRIGKPLIDVL